MFRKKEKGSIFSEMTDAAKICATCKFASPLQCSDDCMCSKKGLVRGDFCCKHYDYNRLMRRPPKKRSIKSDFTADDFSID